MRLLPVLALLGLAASTAWSQTCPAGATTDGRTCTLIRDGASITTPATPAASGRVASLGGDSIRVPIRLFADEVIYVENGEERHAAGYFFEWEHAPGAAFYHVDGHYPDGPQVLDMSLANAQTFGPRNFFPKQIAAAPGHLVYFAVITSSPLPATEPARSNAMQANRSFVRESARPDTHPWAMYASGVDAFEAEVAFSRDTVAVGETFEAYVITRHRRRGTIDDVRPTGPLALTGKGEARIEAGPVPAVLTAVAQADPDTLVYTLVAENEGPVTAEATLRGMYSRYYPDEILSRSRCGDAGHSACRVVIEPGGLAFTAESAFMERDSLFWPDTTYTLRWNADGVETIEIHASLKRNPDPEVDADWPIAVTAGFMSGYDASIERYDWDVPQEATSPTVYLRIRDVDDVDTYHVSERARVRYGWHLTRIATGEDGEQAYEFFDPTLHGWPENQPRALGEWKQGYAAELGPDNKDVVASEARGQPAEVDAELHIRFWPTLYTFSNEERSTVYQRSMAKYLTYRQSGGTLVSRGELDLRRRVGTPSLRGAIYAYGLSGAYGSGSPVLVDSPSPGTAVMSQFEPGFARRYTEAISTGSGLCYGLAWSALLAFQKPAEFAERYRPLAPSLTAVRQLSTVPLTPQTLDVIGAVFTVQERSLGSPSFVSGDETMGRLQAALASDEPDDDIVLTNSHHAVLPYRVTQSTATSFAVHVHNRTFPGEAESSPSQFAHTVGGSIDASYQASDERMADFFVPVPAVTSGTTTVRARSGAEIQVTSANRRGEAPQPITIFRDDPDLPPIGYIVPDGPFQFSLRNARDSVATATVSLSDGTRYDVTRFDTRPGEVDSLFVSGDGLTYVGTDDDRSVLLGLSVLDGTGHRVAEVGPLRVGDAESSSAGWSGDGVRVRNGGPMQTYDLALLRNGSYFTATHIEIDGGAIHTVRPDWSALDGGEVTIDVDDDGDGTPDRTIAVARATSGAQPDAPLALSLGTPYPNPSSGRVTVPYTTRTLGRVRIVVSDALGREVAVLVDATHPPGEHVATLDGIHLAPGVYVVRMGTEGEVATQTLTIVR